MNPAEFKPKLDILPASQRLLWADLADIPAEFTLYGGTAVALCLGHRVSVDFDFFAMNPIDPGELYSRLPFLKSATVIQPEMNTLSCLVDRGEPVKVSFFGLPHLRRVEQADVSDDNRLKIASIIDLAGTNALVIQQRAEAKDYVDINAMMIAGVTLPTALAAAQIIFGSAFNPQITLKALSYFEDGDLPSLSSETKARILHAVAATDLSRLPTLKAGAA